MTKPAEATLGDLSLNRLVVCECSDFNVCFVHGFAKRHHVPNIITFDQPLFWKALEIVQGLPMGHQRLGHNLWLNYQYMSEVSRSLVQSMVELPIHVGSNKDSSTIYG